jgi:hypothetical protein
MNSQQIQQTAKIYAFPPGGRASMKRTAKPASYFDQEVEALLRGPKIVSGSSWYHEVAVDETCER